MRRLADVVGIVQAAERSAALAEVDALLAAPDATSPDDLDVAGRRVVVIGSGATAVTLVPALAELTRAGRRQRDAVLVGLDLLCDADLQGASPYLVEVEQKPGDRLRVFDGRDVRGDLARRPAHDFELLVALRARLAAFELLREEEVHALAAEAGRRVEGRGLTPAATGQARLFRELAACAVERRLPASSVPAGSSSNSARTASRH